MTELCSACVSLVQNLRKMEGDTREDPVKDLNELQNADWVRISTRHTTELASPPRGEDLQSDYSPMTEHSA